MNIKKAVITAAGRNQNRVPLQVLVDSDGEQKAAIRIIIEEVLSAGVDEVALVITPGDQAIYQSALEGVPARMHFLEQQNPRGYGHALLRARPFIGSDSFLHLVSDHLYLSGQSKRCAQQLVSLAGAEACSISAVQATRESMLPFYGAVGGKRADREKLYVVDKVLEKPTPTAAEQELIVPGLRAGHYLCFFGMHLLSATLLEILDRQLQQAPNASLSVSPALDELARREKYLAYEVEGRRYNLGVKFGLFTTQLAFALAGADREEILAQMVEVLALRPNSTRS